MIMNKTIEDLLNRRSIRKYKAEQITDEELDTVLECGKYAPTCKGFQKPRIIVTQDPEMLEKLRVLNRDYWSKQNQEHRREMNAVFDEDDKKEPDPFYGAPTLITVIAPNDSINWVYDANLILANMMNAAYAIGLGSCYINRAPEMFKDERGRKIMEELGINPDEWNGVCNMILGYPDGPHPNPKPRKDDYVLKV